jgi:ABC-type sulfate/molybdate transport systems ATPase subunit
VSVPILYVSHSASEVARLATTVVALEAGRVVAQGPAAEVLGDPAVLPAGAREAGAVLTARVAAASRGRPDRTRRGRHAAVPAARRAGARARRCACASRRMT